MHVEGHESFAIFSNRGRSLLTRCSLKGLALGAGEVLVGSSIVCVRRCMSHLLFLAV